MTSPWSKRFPAWLVAAMVALVVAASLGLATVTAEAHPSRTRSSAQCYISPLERGEYEGYAEEILANYESADPATYGSTALTREIHRENYFGRLDCMKEKIYSALRREITYDQPGESLSAAYAWFLQLVEYTL